MQCILSAASLIQNLLNILNMPKPLFDLFEEVGRFSVVLVFNLKADVNSERLTEKIYSLTEVIGVTLATVLTPLALQDNSFRTIQ